MLRVLEDVSFQHTAILKAGISKLYAAGKKEVVLDLSAASPIDMAAAPEITGLHRLAQENDAQFVIASPLEGLGQAPTLATALQLIRSPLFVLLSQESRMKTRIRLLDLHRNDLRERLKKADSILIKQTKNEHTKLAKRVRDLESQIAALLQGDNVTIPPPKADMKLEGVRRTAHYIMATKGLVEGESL